MKPEALRSLALDCGFHYTGLIPVEALAFDDGVRQVCAQRGCGQYGKSWPALRQWELWQNAGPGAKPMGK